MRIGVALSGGVDSSAAALLMKENGDEVIGIFMRLHEFSDPSFALRTAHELGIEFHEVDLSSQFEDLVIKPFVRLYAEGRTPSPCVVCNRRIKAGLLLEYAQRLECRVLATGHYARIENCDRGPALFKGTDSKKDQSYFLFDLRREQLGRLMFPLGGWTKKQTAAFVRNRGVRAHESEESQELCFVGAGDYRGFLADRGLISAPGNIIDLEGRIRGRHHGIFNYTIGQRKGLGIAAERPLYVLGIHPGTNTLTVGPKSATLSSRVVVRDVNILSKDVTANMHALVKIRSTSGPVQCRLTKISARTLEYEFYEPQSAVTPGQAAVFYAGERVILGGWIARAD
jgi:tRNA-uridine 2-sulfurtransferase